MTTLCRCSPSRWHSSMQEALRVSVSEPGGDTTTFRGGPASIKQTASLPKAMIKLVRRPSP